MRRIVRPAVLIITVLLLVLGGRSSMADPAKTPVVPDVLAARVTTTPDRARLILDLSGTPNFAVLSLDAPPRIAVDLPANQLKLDAPLVPAGTGLVSSFAVAMVGAGRARVTVDLSGPAQVQQAYVLDAFGDQPARLVVDLVPDTQAAFTKRAATDAAAVAAAQSAASAAGPPAAAPASGLAASAAPPATAAQPQAVLGATDAAGGEQTMVANGTVGDQPAAAVAATTPAGQGMPPVTLSAAVPKPKPLIVLDPGHGGVDNGATAPNGVHEKNITLAFALKLQALLVQSGRFDVALTRTDDEYLTLEQRVALGRQNKADLFISIHADSFSQPQVHGASIYTRDEQATDVLDKVLAENENKSEIVAGFAVPKMTPQIVNVLLDLMRRQMRKQSYMAAASIVHALQPSFELRRFPLRQADFFVLQAPDIPSMLIELGFLSSNDDIANLTDPKWQDKAAAAIAQGIGQYFDQLTPAP